MKLRITVLSFLFLFACDSGGDEDSKLASCEVACAKSCQCGTNLCGDGPGGANNGCVRACAGLDGAQGRSEAYTDCMAEASCDQVLAGQCQAMQ